MRKTVFILLLFFATTATAQKSEWLATDKYMHFTTGYIMSSTTYAFTYKFTESRQKAFWYSFGVSIAAGIGKELYDKHVKKTRFDPKDATVTALGGLVGSITFKIAI